MCPTWLHSGVVIEQTAALSCVVESLRPLSMDTRACESFWPGPRNCQLGV